MERTWEDHAILPWNRAIIEPQRSIGMTKATRRKSVAKRTPSKASAKKWVYLFSEVTAAERYGKSWDGVRGLMGGKGANLAEMTRVGVAGPPGFTVTTEACNAYLEAGAKFPVEMW